MRTLKECTDAELVGKIIHEKNSGAAGVLFERYIPRIRRAVAVKIHDTYTVDDIVQDMYIKMVKKMHGGAYSEEGKFSGWILKMTENSVVDYFRGEKRRLKKIDWQDCSTWIDDDGNEVYGEQKSAEDFYFKSPEDEVIEKEVYRILIDAISLLPPEQKEVLLFRIYSSLAFSEIATHTNVGLNTALGRMRYALIKLRRNQAVKNLVLLRSA